MFCALASNKVSISAFKNKTQRIRSKMKFITTILLIISMHAGNVLNAQSSLSGRVTDKTNQQPIPFASISVPDLHMLTTTDSLGNYHFEKIPSATYQIQITGVGFKSFSKVITVNGVSIGNFELVESTTELGEIVVTGSSKAIEIKKAPISIAS